MRSGSRLHQDHSVPLAVSSILCTSWYLRLLVSRDICDWSLAARQLGMSLRSMHSSLSSPGIPCRGYGCFFKIPIAAIDFSAGVLRSCFFLQELYGFLWA